MPVLGLEIVRITRSRRGSSGSSAPIASFRSGPRPARALPNSSRFFLTASRVGSSKVLNTSSISTGSGRAARSGISAPSTKVSSEVPRTIWTYLRPSAERARMMIVESSGSPSTDLSSFSESAAVVEPFPWEIGLISSTTPTRTPPIRTSLPGTSASALGTWAVRR